MAGRGRVGLVVAVLVGFLAAAGPARGDGLRRVDAAWLVPADLVAFAAGDVAAGADAGVWLRTGQARLFGMPELPARSLACGWRRGYAVEAGWDAVGRPPFRDGRVSLRLEAGGRWRWGAQAVWRRLEAGTAAALDRCELGFVAGTRLVIGTRWRATVRCLFPVAGGGDPVLAPEGSTRALVALAGPGCAVALACDEDADGRPSGAWEVLLGLGGGLGVSWRVDGASGALGGGLAWRSGPLRVRTSHLAHPDLGLTHRLELVIGAAGASPW